MAKRCPSCNQMNEDDMHFCSYCGEPFDADVKLIMDLDKMSKRAPAPKAPSPVRPKEDVEVHFRQEEKKSNPLPWVILLLIIAALAALFFFL